MTVIGSAYVNIRAITDKLEGDIRKALDSIKDSVTLTVDADVSSATKKLDELSSSHLADQTLSVHADTTSAQVDLDNLAHTVLGDQTITVHADTSAAVRDLENVANTSHLQDQTVHINVATDPTQAILDLHAIANQSLSSTVDLHANTLEAQAQFDHMMDDMNHRPGPTVTPNVDDVAARLRLALLAARRRIRVDFDVIVNETGAKAIGSYLSRLSGLRVATANAKELVHEFANIDKAVPRIAMMATKMATIGGAAISAVGGVLTLGASLGALIQMVGFAAPGMVAGFAVGMGTLMVALKDFGKQLPDVTAAYKGLSSVIKQDFWAVAKAPIRDMAMTLLPLFKKGLGETSTALGGWASTFASAMKQSLTPDTLAFMFGNLSKSIDIASNANGPFIGGMIELGKVGSALLPRLAQWWVDVASKFQLFIEASVANGNMSAWIEQGITVLKQLGRVISDVANIFNTLTGAAQVAGSDGLGTLVKGLDNIRNALNSPEGARALITIFEGAAAVSGPLIDGIGKIFGALGAAAPAIKSAFESTGAVVGLVGDAIAKIISDPAFQAGFAAMFDGIEKGANALIPVLGTTGPKIGALLSIIGELAGNIGGILGKALEVTLPFITAFKQAIDPLIPILGDALIKIIAELGPTFTIFAKAIADVAPAVAVVVGGIADLIVGLVQTLGPALPGIIAMVLTFMAVFSAGTAIMTVVKSIQASIATYELLKASLGAAKAAQIAFNLSALANPFVLIIAGIAALVVGLVVAYNNVGWFKDGVDAAVKWIGDAWNAMCKWIGEAWNNTIQWIVDAWNNTSGMFTDFFNNTGGMFTDFFNNTVGMFVDFFNNTVGMFTDWVNGIVGMFTDVGTGVSDAFSPVVSFISDVITNIGNVIQTGATNFITNWTNIFNTMSDIFKNVWNGIVWFFEPLVNLISAIITGTLDIIVAIWTSVWEIISTIFYGIWINLVRFFTPIIQSISDAISNFINGVVAVWNTTWQAISDFFTAMWNGLVAFVTPIIQFISDTITNVVNGISATWNAVWQAIVDYFTVIWNLMVAVYSPIIQGISDTITNIVNSISATWNAVWQGIVDYFTMIWNLMVAIYSPIIQQISDTITNIVNGISATWNAVWGAISSFFIGLWNGIVSFVSGAVQNVSNVVTNVVNGISNAWNATWSAISGFVSGVWNGIVNAISGFVGQVSRSVSDVLGTIGRIGGDILNNIGNFPSLLINAGRDLINGLADGIRNASGQIVEVIKGIAGNALNAIKDFFGIKSPSRVMRDQVGKQIGAGLAIGIESSIGRVLKATSALSDAAMMDVPDIKLPSVVRGSLLGLGTASAASAAPLTRGTVTGSVEGSQAVSGAFGAAAGSNTVVNFQVNPSAGLNEEQIAESAMNHLYWKLSTTS